MLCRHLLDSFAVFAYRYIFKRQRVPDLTNPRNGMSRSSSISSVASTPKFDIQHLRAFVARESLDNVIKKLNFDTKRKNNGSSDREDIGEEFVLVKPKERKSKLAGKAAAKSDKIPKNNSPENNVDDVELHLSKLIQKMKTLILMKKNLTRKS